MMKRLIILLTGLLVGFGAFAKERPNFLIIMADDCTYNDLPLYGGQNAKTPNIDRLARQGLTFNRAYLAEAMCQPCRAELMTGQYPLHNGCSWNHSASQPDVKSMPHHLGALGYRVGIAGKVHVKPAAAFPFESVDGFDPNCVRNPTRAHELDGVRSFMARDEGQPFCLVVALVEPHVPWVMGDASKYPPQQLKLPPNLADTPRTRVDFSKYLAEITYMDGQVGEILKVLEESGKANDTLVLFTSEQGSQFPGCKWTNWDTGIHTGLIARWPEKIEGGRTTDAVVQYADILPTLLTLAGGDCNEKPYDGRSFAGVLRGEETSHRQYAYGLHNNIPEGPRYPIRTVTDGEWRYIRNLLPEEIYIEKHLMGIKGTGALNNPYWATWVRDSWNNPHTYKVVRRYMRRPAEQLYHTAEDPYEMSNLAGTPEFSEIQKKLSMELDRWMKRQGDPGAPQDTQRAHKAAKEGKHLYGAK
ncbi:MAG TPA: heparan N-sulfatase [Verrucomicrobiales bacterium]|nr:heparan N-sulfatase [Verrucomicrobiales bacterium]